MLEFITHNKEVIRGERLKDALNKVADDWAKLGHDIRKENDYGDHVTELDKDRQLYAMLKHAEEIRNGDFSGFTVWQRVNEELTGECIEMLPWLR